MTSAERYCFPVVGYAISLYETCKQHICTVISLDNHSTFLVSLKPCPPVVGTLLLSLIAFLVVLMSHLAQVSITFKLEPIKVSTHVFPQRLTCMHFPFRPTHFKISKWELSWSSIHIAGHFNSWTGNLSWCLLLFIGLMKKIHSVLRRLRILSNGDVLKTGITHPVKWKH